MPKKWLNLMKKINFILVILLFASQIQSSNAAQYQSIASIQKAITHYVHTHLTSSSDYKLKLGQIDNRLKLALCNEELTVFSQKVSLKAGRNSIGIKCNSNKKWTIYTYQYLSRCHRTISANQTWRFFYEKYLTT